MVDVMGTIGVNAIKGSLTSKRMLMDVVKAAYGNAVLYDPRIITTISIPKLSGMFPTLGHLPVQKQLEEFEASQTETAKFGMVELKIKKDRFRLGVSDEARLESDLGDPLVLQKSQASGALGNSLEEQIAAVMDVTPQTVTAADWATDKPIRTINKLVQKLKPYPTTAVVMSYGAFDDYVAAIGDKLFVGNVTNNVDKAMVYIPGYNLPVMVSEKLGDEDTKVVYGVASSVPGMVLGTSTVKIREWDNPDQGAYYYQYDVFRTAFSNLMQTPTNLNKGVVKCTLS